MDNQFHIEDLESALAAFNEVADESTEMLMEEESEMDMNIALNASQKRYEEYIVKHMND